MRSPGSIPYALLVLVLLSSVCGHGARLARRQADIPSKSVDPASSAHTPKVSTTSPPASRQTDSSESDSSKKSSTSSVSGSSAVTESNASSPASSTRTSRSTATSVSSASNGTASPASTAGASQPRNVLPLQPKITPGLAVAGVIMALAGVVYALIGIKNKWLHISLSSAFLTSLAVTVLIVYVMDPPITNSVQGAFVVAAVITGVIFGALSLIFPEVTEGLACLLGGFCLSMWLLVLKPGGLLNSSGTKGIFIGAFCAAVYASSFSHYTRPYGLIASTAFAGATVTVLGVDCFSRAGYKEFWLYIWALNKDTFPLDTNTYPHTRGIRVEIACVLFIFVLGLISQLKVWKLIKDRRTNKAAERMRAEHDMHLEEEEVGRRVEEDNNRELADWEMTYGGKNRSTRVHVDSGIGDMESTHKRSGSMTETRLGGESSNENIELSELNRNGRSSQVGPPQLPTGDFGALSIHLLGEDGQSPQGGAMGQPLLPPSTANMDRNKGPATPEQVTNTSPATPGPAIIPLPFTIPIDHDSETNGDCSSVASVAESGFKKLSKASKQRRASLSSSPKAKKFSQSEEALLVPHLDDDLASSIAATVDDIPRLDSPTLFGPGTSPLGTPDLAHSPRLGFVKLSDESSQSLVQKVVGSPAARISRAASDSMLRVALESGAATEDHTLKRPASTNILKSGGLDLLASTDSKNGSGVVSVPNGTPQVISPQPSKPGSKSDGSGENSVVSLSALLPSHVSKVVMSYRTNEWAKHLEAAEKPDLDDIEQDDKDRMDGSDEASVRVTMERPQPTTIKEPPLHEHPAFASRSGQEQLNLVHSPSLNHHRQQAELALTGNLTQIRSSQRSSSQPLLGMPSSFKSPAHPSHSLPQLQRLGTGGMRSASTPILGQPLVSSPTAAQEDGMAPYNLPQAQSSSQTLLAHRESVLRNKVTSMSLNQLAPVPEFADQHTPFDAMTVSTRSLIDDDNISLSERKEMIQQQISRQNMQTPMSAHRLQFDSHQPKRQSDVDPRKQATMLAQWRQSLQDDDKITKRPDMVADTRRAEMLRDRQQSLLNARQQGLANKYRDSVVDERMRRADMLDLHREAMRKMQAVANRHA